MTKTFLTFSFLILFSISGLKAQTTISCDQHKRCWWNSATEIESSCLEYKEYSIIYINKDETEVSITTQKGEIEFKVLNRDFVQVKDCKSFQLKSGTSIMSLLIFYKKNVAVELFRQGGDDYIRTMYSIKSVNKL